MVVSIGAQLAQRMLATERLAGQLGQHRARMTGDDVEMAWVVTMSPCG